MKHGQNFLNEKSRKSKNKWKKRKNPKIMYKKSGNTWSSAFLIYLFFIFWIFPLFSFIFRLRKIAYPRNTRSSAFFYILFLDFSAFFIYFSIFRFFHLFFDFPLFSFKKFCPCFVSFFSAAKLFISNNFSRVFFVALFLFSINNFHIMKPASKPYLVRPLTLIDGTYGYWVLKSVNKCFRYNSTSLEGCQVLRFVRNYYDFALNFTTLRSANENFLETSHLCL
jgi:hypothetical protein